MVNLKIEINEEEFFNAVDEKLDEVVDDVFANSQDMIVQKGIIDEGTLLKSGSIKRAYLEKTIIYSALYADIIEFGRLPGSMPPVDKIKAWVKRKGFAKDDKEATRIAWAISKDIEKNGLEPRPFLAPAIELTIQKLKS